VTIAAEGAPAAAAAPAAAPAQAPSAAEPREEAPPAAEAPKPAPKRRRERAKPKRAEPRWVFEGVVFDLLTARGVFAADLSFLDADGNKVGGVETGPGGRYKVSLPPAKKGGYALKVSRTDYTGRYIDEGDATTSLRDATPDERRILMQAAARNIPWVGNVKTVTRRDLALVPKTSE
jgi:hypothetical protein